MFCLPFYIFIFFFLLALFCLHLLLIYLWFFIYIHIRSVIFLKSCCWVILSKTYMMMMIMIIMTCFCGMADRQKVLFPAGTNVRDSHPRRSPTWASLQHAQNLSSGFVEWSFAVVATTTPPKPTIVPGFVIKNVAIEHCKQ